MKGLVKFEVKKFIRITIQVIFSMFVSAFLALPLKWTWNGTLAYMFGGCHPHFITFWGAFQIVILIDLLMIIVKKNLKSDKDKDEEEEVES